MYGNLARGFEYPLLKFVVISESDIFGVEKKKNKKKKRYDGTRIQDFNDLKVGDYVVQKESDTYKITIEDDVEKVTITATPSDSNAKVTGAGEKTIVDGDNTFKIKVTAQNGNVKTYTVIITKSSAYIKVSQIEENLSLDKVALDVKLENGDKLSPELLNKIKESTKIVNLYYFDDKNELLYIWVLDSSVIKGTVEFDPIINVNTDKRDQVFSKINYVESIIFELNSVAPEGARLRFNIAGKYESNDNTMYNVIQNKILIEEKI